MNTNNPTTDNVELEMIEVSHQAEMLDALERLESNRDFQKVVLDGYIKDKAADSVSLLAHPHIKQQGARPDVMEDLVACSNLQYYFYMIKQLGAGAKADLMDSEGPETED